uniref:Uncharacterized protein n=1 Tax=viral metagenome TaxID=1070528 RepID=A0A6C0JUT3_9ZZZZ
MAEAQCNGLKSFPIDINGFSPSHQTYNSLVEPLNLSIDWGAGTDIPEFSQSASVQSGELYHSSFDSTKLAYSSSTYTLMSVQITRPTHIKWLALTSSEAINNNNQEDIILTFINTVNALPTFIILVNPVIRIARPIVSSAFLTAFANQTTNNAIGPDSLFPNNVKDQFAYYTTCGTIPTLGTLNALVVVNVQGLLVWDGIMESIKSIYSTQRNTQFPAYINPFYNLFLAPPTVISDIASFSSKILVSNGYASSVQTAPSIQKVVTDSYKCVTMNPETDISGGALYIDSSTGTPMTSALAKRQLEKDNYNSSYTAAIPYTILQNYTKTFLIIVFSVVFVFIILYAILSLTVGESEMGSGASRLKLVFANILKVPVYVVIAFFCTFIGLFVGITISANSSGWQPGPVTTGSASGSASGNR